MALSTSIIQTDQFGTRKSSNNLIPKATNPKSAQLKQTKKTKQKMVVILDELPFMSLCLLPPSSPLTSLFPLQLT